MVDKKFIFRLICFSCWIIMVSMFILTIIDITIGDKTIDTKSIPCIDEHGNEFEDELCIDEITCSTFGLTADYACFKLPEKYKWKT